MTRRKLTFEQADELRRTRERTGASYAMLAHIFGINRSTAWEIVNGDSYQTFTQAFGYDEDPTPHEQITIDRVDEIHRNSRADGWNAEPIIERNMHTRRETGTLDCYPEMHYHNLLDRYRRGELTEPVIPYMRTATPSERPLAAD